MTKRDRDFDQMLQDAIKAGYSVEVELREHGSTLIVKRNKRGRIKYGIEIFPDKTAIRADVELGLCLCIRGIKAQREVLKL